MNSSYAALTGLIVFLILFIYFCFLSVSLRIVRKNQKNESQVKSKKIKEPWKVRNLIDPKNKSLSFLDLGNHVLILGIVLFAFFIIKNA